MQLEPIIRVRFKKFISQYQLDRLEESKSFEYYVNYLIFTSHQSEVFSVKTELFELANVGGSDDLGIDGIGVKINDTFISSIEEIKEYISSKIKMNIEIIFIQSKYRPNFVASEFLTFSSGIKDVVSENHYKKANNKVKEWIDIIEFLMSEKAMLLWSNKPSIRAYYIAMGKWENDNNILAYENALRDDVERTGSFETFFMHYIDSSSLIKIIDNNENNFEIVLLIDDQISFPEVKTVTNSAIVYTNSDELIKLLKTDDGIIRKSLFYDNVRAYQGDTNINNEIMQTIEENPEMFILLNNGITIVCDKFDSARRRISIKNPQIVNGCQTCNVIFNYYLKNHFKQINMPLALKVIATEDNNLVNQVVRTTNRQNIVYDEVFEITREFHKNLEEYFLCAQPVSDNNRIFYERRSKQYANDFSIKYNQKVNLKMITQASVAILLEEPHMAHRHQSVLLNNYRNKLFLDIHSYEPYYMISEIYLQFEQLFSENKINEKTYKPYINHIMMIYKYLAANKMPNLSDQKLIDKYCEQLRINMKKIGSDGNIIQNVITIFNNATRHWTNELKRSKYGIKDNKEFTDVILGEVAKFLNSPEKYSKVESFRVGFVLSVKKDKNNQWYGFIKSEPDNIIFFQSMNKDTNFNQITNQFVQYDIMPNSDGNQTAFNVKIWERQVDNLKNNKKVSKVNEFAGNVVN
jgi:hypothetical protein